MELWETKSTDLKSLNSRLDKGACLYSNCLTEAKQNLFEDKYYQPETQTISIILPV